MRNRQYVFLDIVFIGDSAHPASPSKIACKNGLAILHTRIAIGTRYSETGRLRFFPILSHHAKFYPKSLIDFLDIILIGDFACAVFAGSHIFSAYAKNVKTIEFFAYAVLPVSRGPVAYAEALQKLHTDKRPGFRF